MTKFAALPMLALMLLPAWAQAQQAPADDQTQRSAVLLPAAVVLQGEESGLAKRPTRTDRCRFDQVTLSCAVAGELGSVSVGLISGCAINQCSALALGAELVRHGHATAAPLFLRGALTAPGGSFRPIFFMDLGYSLMWVDGGGATEGSGAIIGCGLGHRFGRGGKYAAVMWRIQPSRLYHERHRTDGLYHHVLSLSLGVPLSIGPVSLPGTS